MCIRAWSFTILAAVAVFSLLSGTKALAAVPEGFVNQTLATGLVLPTDAAFLPDGRVLITEKNGKLRIFQNRSLVELPALTLSISTGGDRGLMSVAVDPEFSTNWSIYLLYTSASNRQRISRFILNGNAVDPASERVIFENPKTWGGFLNAGTIRFGPDGKLYATMGSNGEGMTAQDLSAAEGKLLRMNTDGSAPSDNPYAGLPGAVSTIYSIGLRNPWKFNFDQNGKAIIGDVGESQYEKIVGGVPGANFGWPTYEGDCRPNCGGVTPPIFTIPHGGQGAAVVAGDVYDGNAFPLEFSNHYFFGDYVQGSIRHFINDGAPPVPAEFASGLGALAWIEAGPGGCLYYLTIFPGELHRICYGAGSMLPVAMASSDRTYGPLDLTVQFSSAGSHDPSGGALRYQWDFGDGATSTLANPIHTYTTKAVRRAVLTVIGAEGSASTSLTIFVGYLPPSITIAAPASDRRWNAGEAVFFRADAVDPEDGALPPSNLSWKVIFHHNTHIHSPEEFIGASEGTFVMPDHSHTSAVDLAYEFQVIATNNIGLSSTTSRIIQSNVANLSIDSAPSGLSLLLDDQPIVTPYRVLAIPGYLHTLGAPTPQTFGGVSYVFRAWSDGGAQTHAIGMPNADVQFIATYEIIAQNFTSSASLPASAAPGEAISIRATTTASAAQSSDLVDLELWGTAGKVAQKVFPVRYDAGIPVSVVWEAIAPGTTGTYTVKIGIFSPDWSALHYWNDNAGTILVSGTATSVPPESLRYITSAAPGAVSYAPAAPAAINTTVTADGSVSNLILDAELWGPGGKVAQQTVPMTLTKDTPVQFVWNFSAPPAGTYTVKIGIFSPDWSALHYWNDNAGTLAVSGAVSTVTPASYAVSVTMPQNTFSRGEVTAITTMVTATADVPNAVIDTEVYDQNGVKVRQSVINANLVKNQTFSSIWNLILPDIDGVYVVKVGVFSSDWSQTLFWKDSAFRYTIGTPAGGPQPGVTYPITIYVPQDGSTVSGVVEIKAAIPALDINTYSIEWRTGDGVFLALDTDPVGQSYKHAWIDFSPWNWSPTGVYLLEFQATNLSGNLIGGKTISIRVAH